ncbi:CvpA family protein [Polaribacter irgensii 23-P]|uniref:CvpA family protein n=1 Tax=Polaribacter irgensii 23-P TaxID=313594 RepID=A4BWU0_9FLAO|nr:CvpA family protein [Polaribacter irgensii]EAR13431.1 CvpA family protein [Polaribacter irgensii 23-P]
MNVFDVVIAALLIFGFVRGVMKGFFVEVASLLALVGGVYGAIHFSHFIVGFIKEYVSWSDDYIALVAFAGTFIIIIIVISVLGKMLTKLANFASLGIVNKILGGVFGALKIGLILSVVFIFFGKVNNTIPFVKKETLDTSILYAPVKKIVQTIFPSIIKEDRNVETDLLNLVK